MSYYVYILTNAANTVLYTGVTRDLVQRTRQHREGSAQSFTRRYNVKRLVHYEEFESAYDAITREKQIKSGSRKRKMQLIDTSNPRWRDLYPEMAQGTE